MTEAYQYPGKDENRHFSEDESNIPVERSTRPSTFPHVHYGLVASGDKLVTDAKLRYRLMDKHGIIRFETEAAGLMELLAVAVIREVCDYRPSRDRQA